MSDDEKNRLRHDVANQLTAISLCAEKIGLDASAEQRKYLDIIKKRCIVLVKGVDGFLR